MERQIELYWYVRTLKAVVSHCILFYLRMIYISVPAFHTQKCKKLVIAFSNFSEELYGTFFSRIELCIRKPLSVLFVSTY